MEWVHDILFLFSLLFSDHPVRFVRFQVMGSGGVGENGEAGRVRNRKGRGD